MKPLKIHMKNIGPFIDEELDFTELDEVFLLCGDTGAGKTTIFDAMTFALYGEFLGARKGKSKDFRSQFASDGDESLVEFEFSSGGEKFRVARTLPYNYINRNGKLSQKDSMVSLEIWNDGCGRYENVNAGKTEINSRIEQTTGLRADEFSKIVVLPQENFLNSSGQTQRKNRNFCRNSFQWNSTSRSLKRLRKKMIQFRRN